MGNHWVKTSYSQLACAVDEMNNGSELFRKSHWVFLPILYSILPPDLYFCIQSFNFVMLSRAGPHSQVPTYNSQECLVTRVAILPRWWSKDSCPYSTALHITRALWLVAPLKCPMFILISGIARQFEYTFHDIICVRFFVDLYHILKWLRKT